MRNPPVAINQYKADRKEGSIHHDRRALVKACEILSFLIRDAAYVSTENFEYCIHCIRTYIEVIVVQWNPKPLHRQQKNSNALRRVTSANALTSDYSSDQFNQQRGQSRPESADEDDLQDAIREECQTLASQLLLLMDSLHTKAAQTFKYLPLDTTKSIILWNKCWCPILQGKDDIDASIK